MMMFLHMAVEVSSDFRSRCYSCLCNCLPLVPVRALQLFIRADPSPLLTLCPCPAGSSLLLFCLSSKITLSSKWEDAVSVQS